MSAATSSSDRYAAAREALDAFEAARAEYPISGATQTEQVAMAAALRALIQPADTAETPETIADRVIPWDGASLVPQIRKLSRRDRPPRAPPGAGGRRCW